MFLDCSRKRDSGLNPAEENKALALTFFGLVMGATTKPTKPNK